MFLEASANNIWRPKQLFLTVRISDSLEKTIYPTHWGS